MKEAIKITPPFWMKMAIMKIGLKFTMQVQQQLIYSITVSAIIQFQVNGHFRIKLFNRVST